MARAEVKVFVGENGEGLFRVEIHFEHRCKPVIFVLLLKREGHPRYVILLLHYACCGERWALHKLVSHR